VSAQASATLLLMLLE
jgi:hypothetical protein